MKSIVFIRNKLPIQAKIIKTTIEPLDNSNSRQVVFFCKDLDGRRYRVPKSEVVARGVTARDDKKKSKVKKSKRERRHNERLDGELPKYI